MCNKNRKSEKNANIRLQKTKKEAVSNAKLRPLLKFDKGIVRFEEKAAFATEGVHRYDESSANGGRKSPLN